MVDDYVKRINLLGIPVDIVSPDDLETVVKAMYADGKNHQIVLLSNSDLMLARRSREFRTMLAGASLVIPISMDIIKTARFLRRPLPYRYEPFDFIIRLLGILERWSKSVYLLGGSQKALAKATRNIRTTFPRLHIVGSHSSRVRRSSMPRVVQAIRKASPTLLLVGQGVPGSERWIPATMKDFNAGMYIWCSDVFDVFAERKQRPPSQLFDRGLEWVYYLPRKPWIVTRFTMILGMKMTGLWYRLRRR